MGFEKRGEDVPHARVLSFFTGSRASGYNPEPAGEIASG
jgi:hypothetical protein